MAVYHARKYPPKHQPDAVLSQANPVSATWYPVLDAKNVRIISIVPTITWAVTQPTPLEAKLTIDGNVIVFAVGNPVSTIPYSAHWWEHLNETQQNLGALSGFTPYRAFLVEGRSVKVEVRITWAVTQPDPLECRVKHARW